MSGDSPSPSPSPLSPTNSNGTRLSVQASPQSSIINPPNFHFIGRSREPSQIEFYNGNGRDNENNSISSPSLSSSSVNNTNNNYTNTNTPTSSSLPPSSSYTPPTLSTSSPSSSSSLSSPNHNAMTRRSSAAPMLSPVTEEMSSPSSSQPHSLTNTPQMFPVVNPQNPPLTILASMGNGNLSPLSNPNGNSSFSPSSSPSSINMANIGTTGSSPPNNSKPNFHKSSTLSIPDYNSQSPTATANNVVASPTRPRNSTIPVIKAELAEIADVITHHNRRVLASETGETLTDAERTGEIVPKDVHLRKETIDGNSHSYDSGRSNGSHHSSKKNHHGNPVSPLVAASSSSHSSQSSESDGDAVGTSPGNGTLKRSPVSPNNNTVTSSKDNTHGRQGSDIYQTIDKDNLKPHQLQALNVQHTSGTLDFLRGTNPQSNKNGSSPSSTSPSSSPSSPSSSDDDSGHALAQPLLREDVLSFPATSWKYTMRFPSQELEHFFNSAYYSKALLMIRLTSLLVMIGNALGGLTDLVVYQADQRVEIWLIRYCAITPACIFFLFITRHYLFFTHRQLFTAIWAIFVGCMLMWISAIGLQPNHGIYMILFDVYSLFLGFHYIVSAIVNFVVFLVFIGWDWYVTVTEGYGDSSEVTGQETSITGQRQWILSLSYLFLTNVMLIVVGYFLESSFRGAFLQMQRLRCEQHKTNIVLYNILPKNIAQNLVQGYRSADYYRSASVLFCDIYDFKSLTSSLNASDLVTLLNDVYSFFDRLTDQHDVLKIETIGEVYLVASGLPEESETHAEACCYLALDMQQLGANFYTLVNEKLGTETYDSKRIKREQITGTKTKKEKPHIVKRPIIFRIGIHTGDVIAGVIGVKLPRYRLFGDTINTASRMQSTCSPGKIQVSESTYAIVSETFTLEDRGEIQVKGKGMMHTYLLTGRNNAYEHRISSIANEVVQKLALQDELDDGSQRAAETEILTEFIKKTSITVPNSPSNAGMGMKQNNENNNNSGNNNGNSIGYGNGNGSSSDGSPRLSAIGFPLPPSSSSPSSSSSVASPGSPKAKLSLLARFRTTGSDGQPASPSSRDTSQSIGHRPHGQSMQIDVFPPSSSSLSSSSSAPNISDGLQSSPFFTNPARNGVTIRNSFILENNREEKDDESPDVSATEDMMAAAEMVQISIQNNDNPNGPPQSPMQKKLHPSAVEKEGKGSSNHNAYTSHSNSNSIGSEEEKGKDVLGHGRNNSFSPVPRPLTPESPSPNALSSPSSPFPDDIKVEVGEIDFPFTRPKSNSIVLELLRQQGTSHHSYDSPNKHSTSLHESLLLNSNSSASKFRPSNSMGNGSGNGNIPHVAGASTGYMTNQKVRDELSKAVALPRQKSKVRNPNASMDGQLSSSSSSSLPVPSSSSSSSRVGQLSASWEVHNAQVMMSALKARGQLKKITDNGTSAVAVVVGKVSMDESKEKGQILHNNNTLGVAVNSVNNNSYNSLTASFPSSSASASSQSSKNPLPSFRQMDKAKKEKEKEKQFKQLSEDDDEDDGSDSEMPFQPNMFLTTVSSRPTASGGSKNSAAIGGNGISKVMGMFDERTVSKNGVGGPNVSSMNNNNNNEVKSSK